MIERPPNGLPDDVDCRRVFAGRFVARIDERERVTIYRQLRARGNMSPKTGQLARNGYARISRDRDSRPSGSAVQDAQGL